MNMCRAACTVQVSGGAAVPFAARVAVGSYERNTVVAARHIGIKPIYSVSMPHIRSLQPLVSPVLCA